MAFYLCILLFVMAVAVIENGGYKIPCSHTILFLVLWVAAGTSRDFAVDYPAYARIYDNADHGTMLFVEPVWAWISNAMHYLGFASRGWFMLTSLIIMGLFFYGIKRMSGNFTLSVVLFVACYFYFETINAIRQYVAIAILFAAFHWLVERKTWKYLVAVVVAAQFHMSAWIMLPLAFAVRIKYDDRILGALVAVTFLFGPLIMDKLLGVAFGLIGGGRYASYAFVDFGAQVNTGLVKIFLNALAMAALLLSGRIRRLDPRYFLYVNAVVISIVIYNIFANFLPGVRMYWYLFPMIIILFPIMLRTLVVGSRPLVTGSVVAAFALAAVYSLNMVAREGLKTDYGFDMRLFN